MGSDPTFSLSDRRARPMTRAISSAVSNERASTTVPLHVASLLLCCQLCSLGGKSFENEHAGHLYHRLTPLGASNASTCGRQHSLVQSLPHRYLSLTPSSAIWSSACRPYPFFVRRV
jgi:hypothetical protein